MIHETKFWHDFNVPWFSGYDKFLMDGPEPGLGDRVTFVEYDFIPIVRECVVDDIDQSPGKRDNWGLRYDCTPVAETMYGFVEHKELGNALRHHAESTEIWFKKGQYTKEFLDKEREELKMLIDAFLMQPWDVIEPKEFRTPREVLEYGVNLKRRDS